MKMMCIALIVLLPRNIKIIYACVHWDLTFWSILNYSKEKEIYNATVIFTFSYY